LFYRAGRLAYNFTAMAKKKSKEQLLAEIAFDAGRASMFESDYDMHVKFGAKIALAKWKEQTGGKKPEPSDIERARKQWISNGSPKEGIRFGSCWYLFAPDGSYLLKESFDKNFKA
jgi:hypothetical protein